MAVADKLVTRCKHDGRCRGRGREPYVIHATVERFARARAAVEALFDSPGGHPDPDPRRKYIGESHAPVEDDAAWRLAFLEESCSR